MSNIITNLIQAKIDASESSFDAKILTRPTLALSDGTHNTYCVDLDVGQPVPLTNVPVATGARDVFYAGIGSAVKVQRSASGWFEVVGLSKRMPGTYNRIAVTIPSFAFNPQTVYAGTPPDPGSSGGVIIGDPVPVGLSSRLLTFAELATFGGFGTVPLGAIAIYQGTTFIGLR